MNIPTNTEKVLPMWNVPFVEYLSLFVISDCEWCHTFHVHNAKKHVAVKSADHTGF